MTAGYNNIFAWVENIHVVIADNSLDLVAIHSTKPAFCAQTARGGLRQHKAYQDHVSRDK
jgi:hypothetical protein